MTKTALEISAEIDDLSELSDEFETALQTLKDGAVTVTLKKTVVTKAINILSTQIKERCDLLNSIKITDKMNF